MKIVKSWFIVTLAAGLAFWLAGCNPSAPPSSSAGSGTTDGHADEHGHEGHDHAHHHHGPHDGEIMVIGDEEYHAEWTHENGKVTFYILDAEAKKEVPIAAEKITIDVKIGEAEPTTYELLAVNPSGDEMKTAQFETEDKNVEGVLESLTKGVVATLNVEIDGKTFKQKIEKEVHDHDHAHAHGDTPAEEKPAAEKPADEKPTE